MAADVVAKGDSAVCVGTWYKARPLPGFVHDLLGAFDPHGNDVWASFWFEDKPCDAPFEVAHYFLGVLVDTTFGEDVKPGVAPRGVGGGGGEGVVAICAVGISGCCGGGEGVCEVGGDGGWVRCGAGGGAEGAGGEEPDRLCYGWLEEATVKGVGMPVGWEDLA